MTKTVKMTRDGKTADVHPAEVDQMKVHGWSVAEPPKPALKAGKKG